MRRYADEPCARCDETGEFIVGGGERRCTRHRHDGAVVEWEARATSTTLGLTTNAPVVRRVGRVNHARPDGLLVIFDTDDVRCIIDPAKVTVIAEKAEAGWGNL